MRYFIDLQFTRIWFYQTLNEVDVAISRSTSWLRRCPGYSRACNVFRRQVRKQRRGSRKSSKCVGSTLTDWKANWNGRETMMTWSAKSVFWDQSTFRRYQLANLEKAWNIFLWSALRRSNKLRIWSLPIHLTHSVSGLTIFHLRSLHIKDARHLILIVRYWRKRIKRGIAESG